MKSRTRVYTVHDAHTNLDLAGTPSDDLVAASLAERHTGRVGAYRDADGIWQHLREDEMSTYEEARVVYVRQEGR